ncbi:hypothetical protein ACS0TY_032375 [Phlomoides rotata]
MSPAVCIVNYYNTNGQLGLHQIVMRARIVLQEGYQLFQFLLVIQLSSYMAIRGILTRLRELS